MADVHKNFAYSLVATAPSPASSGTSLVVTAGQGTKFPTTPFNATIWPTAAQPLTTTAEIVRVTGISTDTLTITRAQEGTGARTVIVGDQIAATVTALTLKDAESRLVSIQVTDPTGAALTTGDGKAYFRVPVMLNGMNLVRVEGHVTTVSSSGIPTFQIANVTDTTDMLSTKLTIDASEKDSSTAAAAAVIDTGLDDVATGDELRVDCDVAGTGAKGVIIQLTFQAP